MRFLFLSAWLLCNTISHAQIDTALLSAIRTNNLTALRRINPESTQLNRQDANGATALMWAVYHADPALVQYLLDKGANPMLEGVICLDDTCGGYYGNLLCIAAGEGKLDLVRFLVETVKLDVNALEWNIHTCQKGIPLPRPDTVGVNGWKPYIWETPSGDTWTALTWAVSNRHLPVAAYLLEKGADPDVNPGEPMKITIAQQNTPMAQLLLRYRKSSLPLSWEDKYHLAKFGMDTLVIDLIKNGLLSLENGGEKRRPPGMPMPPDSLWANTAAFFKYHQKDTLFIRYAELEIQALQKAQPLPKGALAGKYITLGQTYFKLENHEKADSLFKAALAFTGDIFGKQSESYAILLRTYADLLMKHSLYKKAEQPFRELLDIWTGLTGVNSRAEAVCLNNIGWNLNNQHRYREAEPYLRKSLERWHNPDIKEDKEIKTVLWNLGTCLLSLEKYEEAEVAWKERQTLTEALFGPLSHEYAVVLNDLGWLYRLKKDYAQAETLLLKSLEIRQLPGNKDLSESIVTKENLADVYRYADNDLMLWKTKLSLLDTLLRYEGYEEKKSALWDDLADICVKKLKDYDLAIAYYQEVLAAKVKMGKHNTWKYWDTQDNIANCYFQKKDYQKAGEWWEKYADSGYRVSKERMFLISKLLKDVPGAVKWYRLFLDALKQDNYDLFKNSGKAFKYTINAWHQDEYHLGYSAAFQFNTPETVAIANDIALYTKNAILNESRQIAQFIASSKIKTFQDSSARLGELQKAYANLFHFHTDGQALEQEKWLTEQISALQAYLSNLYYENTLPQAIDVSWKNIHQALKPAEAAIEFVDFRLHREDWTDSVIYAAIVLRPEWDAPRLVPLFEEKALSAWLDDKQVHDLAYAARLYPPLGRAVPTGERPTGLHPFIWAKLDSLLQGAKTVYFSTSGYLNRLNLGAIANPAKQLAAERYQLIQMSSTRQILSPKRAPISNQTAALFGGLQYSTDSSALVQAVMKYRVDASNKTRALFDVSGMAPLDTLFYARSEVMQIGTVLTQQKYAVRRLTDLNGTEEALYALCTGQKSPGILHFSTHGFFFPKPDGDSLGILLPFAVSNNSMLRSGIALAGCNQIWTTGKTYARLHDGILTAHEAAQLDLGHTELVVLSGCETGLGDLNKEGGVFGLQRAFLQAGAHYVMMSLWQVDDHETSVFMTIFYEKWLKEQKTVPEAFRATQLEMKHKNPYFWAGFVLVE